MRYWTLKEIIDLLNCNYSPPLPAKKILGYECDSRLVQPGQLFFALKGERVDGHSFLKEVKEKGAIAAVVCRNYDVQLEGFPLLYVDDPLKSLQELARLTLNLFPARIVGVTGSLGKTSTKEFLKKILETKYRVAASPGNRNSQVGLPLAILNDTSNEDEIIVLEMGMTLEGQINQLVQIAPPEVAVITQVALVHACNFESIEEIALAKGEIFSHPSTRIGILPIELSNFSKVQQIGKCEKITFSTCSNEANYSSVYLDQCCWKIISSQEGEEIELKQLSLPGRHIYHNLLAAIVVARYFKISWEQINEVIPHLTLPERRLQFIHKKDALFLNDSYNAAELSVKAALEVLPVPVGEGKKIAVIGSMMELGKFSDECHYRVGEFALNFVEELYCLGEECLPMTKAWEKAGRTFHYFLNRDDLVSSLRSILKPNDVVLLKGSRSKELWKILDEL